MKSFSTLTVRESRNASNNHRKPRNGVIEHAHTSNLHMHIGAEHGEKKVYPYWPHITGDIRTPTWKIGDQCLLVLDAKFKRHVRTASRRVLVGD